MKSKWHNFYQIPVKISREARLVVEIFIGIDAWSGLTTKIECSEVVRMELCIVYNLFVDQLSLKIWIEYFVTYFPRGSLCIWHLSLILYLEWMCDEYTQQKLHNICTTEEQRHFNEIQFRMCIWISSQRHHTKPRHECTTGCRYGFVVHDVPAGAYYLNLFPSFTGNLFW